MPELLGHVLPRVLYRRFSVWFDSPRMAKPGPDSVQYASIAAADSSVALVVL